MRAGRGNISIQSSSWGSSEEHATRANGKQSFSSSWMPAASCSGMRPSSAFVSTSLLSQHTSPPPAVADSCTALRVALFSGDSLAVEPISRTRFRSCSAFVFRTPSVILKVQAGTRQWLDAALFCLSLSFTSRARTSRPSVSASTKLAVRPKPPTPETLSSRWSSLPSKSKRAICALLMPCSALLTQAWMSSYHQSARAARMAPAVPLPNFPLRPRKPRR
mmetsp:Transcript_41943/g.113104  ORF Transcript_41943/g.113104 Transcript_41943/m.113104 type:complete len:220 (-) Transcript_41943:861-1520(-)